MTRKLLVLAVLSALLAQAADSQAPIRTTPTDLNASLNQRLQNSAEGARWLWGTLRVEPTFGLRDVRLVDDVEVDSDAAIAGRPSSSDVTIGTFAGLNFYQLFGQNSAAAFFVQPQYDHWIDLEDRSRLNLNFGVALAAETNRFFLDLEGIRNENQGIATQEAEQIINNRRDLAEVRLGIPVYRSLALAANYQHSETEHLLDETASSTIPDFTRLDQTTDSFAAGVQVEPGRVTRLFLGFREVEVDTGTTLRDHEAEGPTALVEIDAGVLSFRADVSRLEFVPTGSTSTFEPIDATVGQLDIILDGLGPHAFGWSVQRSIDASVRAAFSDFEATLGQLEWRYQATNRVQTRLGYRIVDRDYRDLDARQDEQTGWLASVSYIVNKFRVAVQYERSELESSVDQFDRDTQRLGLSFSIGLPGISWPPQ